MLYAMNKAFTKEDSDDDDDALAAEAAALPAGTKYYITRTGFLRLKAELDQLVKTERPEVVSVVSWAASNGDRSENGDYIYGKRRLREIDRRIRFLIKRLESATVVDPETQAGLDQVFFGATVTVCDAAGEEATYQIVGVDETASTGGKISWISPLAKALMKAREGDTVRFMSPGGWRELDIVEIRYL
jgi:transcription elongation factor GreB